MHQHRQNWKPAHCKESRNLWHHARRWSYKTSGRVRLSWWCHQQYKFFSNVKCQKTFIGGAVCREFESEAPDIHRRIGLAGVAVRRLNNIWKNKAISKWTKVKLYETLVLSILCYNSETWTLTAETNRQLRIFEMGCLRRILGVTRRDYISHFELWHQSQTQARRW